MNRGFGRIGIGARFDAPEAPTADLLEARRAAASFARVLGMLRDDALFAESNRTGVSRALIVAELAYDARRLACDIAELRGIRDVDSVPKPDAAALGSTLPPRALRYLYAHTTIHLDVEWRDLSGSMWDARLQDGMEVRAIPSNRALALRSAMSALV